MEEETKTEETVVGQPDLGPGKYRTAEKTPEQAFIERYNALCSETGLQIVTQPVWLARDDGSYSLVLRSSISKLPTPQPS